MSGSAAPAQSARRNEWLDSLATVAGGLAIALALRVIIFQPYTIPSASMEPGLLVGDYIVVSKWSYGWSRASIPFNPPLPGGRFLGRSPHRGDVVVFRLPRDPTQVYVKRLIGLPGDRVQVRHGTVFVNDRPIERQALGPGLDAEDPEVPVLQVQEHRPDGTPYVTFDRGPGRDGQDTEVYRVPAGDYFMMGDNRDNSLDSRWSRAMGGVDFVPAQNLIGKARFVMASWDHAAVLKPWTWIRLKPSRFLKPIR
jgi:signal peptidase I